MITVAKLIEKLQLLDPNAVILVPGVDHSYNRLSAAEGCLAEKHYFDYFEYHGDDQMIDETSEAVPAVVMI